MTGLPGSGLQASKPPDLIIRRIVVTQVTSHQMKALWALAHRAGLDEGELHALVVSRTGRASLRELRRAEAAAVIDKLLAKVGAGAPVPQRVGAVTRPQQAQLARLAAGKIVWAPERLPALAQCSKRVFKTR